MEGRTEGRMVALLYPFAISLARGKRLIPRTLLTFLAWYRHLNVHNLWCYPDANSFHNVHNCQIVNGIFLDVY